MRMAHVFWAFFFLCDAVCVLGVDFRYRALCLGDSVTLSASEPCRGDETAKFTHRLKDNSEKTVGVVEKGVWVPQEDRVTHNSVTSVVLTNANYNDNGVYEFTCDNRLVTVTRLDVVVPSEVPVAERETVVLPYYSVTAGEHDVEFIRWEKNGKLVCELSLSSRKVTYGTEFEGRVSVSHDWFSLGDLSLKLERAQPEDEGDFFIYKEDKNGKKTGHPAAVRLKFKEKSSNQIAFTPLTARPPQSCTEEKGMATWATVLITAAVMIVVFAALVGLFVLWQKSRKTSGHSDGGPSTDVERRLVRDRGPAGSQINGILCSGCFK